MNIFRHDGNSPGVDGTQVGIVKQPDKVCLRCFLETQYRRRLESQVCLVVLGDLPHQPLERQFLDEQCRAPLEVTDVLQSYSSCSVSVGFYLPPLHSRLVDLPLLLISPIQYTVTQFGSLLRPRDVEGWQLPVDQRVCYGLLAWFLASH